MNSRSVKRGFEDSFTLLELLVVISIIVILLVLIVPAFTSIKGGSDLTTAGSNVEALLDQSRAYAMANNTYVFIGIVEVDSSVSQSAVPQTTTNSTRIGGRVAIAIVASKDGTHGYDVTSTSLPNPAWANYNNGGNLVAISKLQRFENIHLAQVYSSLGTIGNMARPDPSANYVVGNDSCTSVTPFDWPIGAPLGSGQYSFTKVINIDPQGVARIQGSTNTDTIVQVMEIGLQQTHGAVPTPTPSFGAGNVAAIQIDGMTGATRIYRP
jgi:type II secretory pathway pseudopilin PulG